jgi:hypothetical protein
VQGIKKKEVKAKAKRMRKGNLKRKSTNQGHNMTVNGRYVKLI